MPEETENERQQSDSRADTAERPATPGGPPIGQRLSGIASTAFSLAHRKWVVIALLAGALVFGLLAIVFAGVWAAAIKGYFGERLHVDAERDDPTRLTQVAAMEGSPNRFGIPASASQPRVSDPDGQLREYCQFVVPDELDRRFLREGYTFTQAAIGSSQGTHIEPDRAMLINMEYLCRRHRRLGVSHIISAYVNMRLDPEQQRSRDPQIIQNISAHNRGNAWDLVEIDFVYKVFRSPCPGTPNWNIEYWNDLNQMLLFLPCREPINNVNTTFAGGPATAIPIRVLWQDQPNQFAPGGLPLNISTALSTIASYLGISPEALRFAGGGLGEMLAQIGRTYLEDLLGLPLGSLFGDNLQAILQNAFGGRLAELLGQLPRPFWGTTFPDLTRSVGAGVFERALGLLPGSLQGWGSPAELFRSVGLETAAAIFRVPSDWLRDPQRVAQILGALSQEDRDALTGFGTGFGLGGGLGGLLPALESGDQAAVDRALESYGRSILAITLGLPADAFICTDTDVRSCPDPYGTLEALADRTGLSQEVLRDFIGAILSGGSAAGLFEEHGAPSLESALNLPVGSIAVLLSGGQLPLDTGTVAAVAIRLGVTDAVAREFLAAINQGQLIAEQMQLIGSTILGSAFQLSDPTALFQIAHDVASTQLRQLVEREIATLINNQYIPSELFIIADMFSGNFSDFLAALSHFGGLQLGEIFDLSIGEIQQLIAGDLSVLLTHPAFQQLTESILSALNLNVPQLTNILNGLPMINSLANIGNTLNGFLSITGVDQFLIMERVYRPEARRKVHLVLRELLEMPFVLNDIDLRVTQLITYSHERDVVPFEADGTLERVYGRNRSRNFGLFSMREAFDHLHISY